MGAVPRTFGTRSTNGSSKQVLEEAMLTIRFMERNDQDAYMLKKELSYHQITD
jgi:hypothetical protein